MFKSYFLEFKNGTKVMFKEFFDKKTNKKQRANMWSFLRLVIPLITLILSIIASIFNILPLLIASGVIAGFGALTDFFDGKSARKYKSSSEYGKILDQVTDKCFSLIIGINVACLNPLYLVTLALEALISTINISYKLKYKNLDIKSSKIGRIKQWPLYLSLALGYFSILNNVLFLISNISILFTSIMQVITANSYIKQNNSEVKKMELKELIQNYNTIDNKSNELEKINSNDNVNRRKKEEYIELKNLLNKIINLKEETNEEVEKLNNFQKQKK